MISKEELIITYEKFSDSKIIKLAKKESKGLKNEAIDILKNEIIKRGLDKNLLEWIDLERNFFQAEELEDLKKIIKNSKYNECGKKGLEIRGYRISSIQIFDVSYEADMIICKKCGTRKRYLAYLETITLGWISFTSFIRVPFYFISELFLYFSRNKQSECIIDDFIYKNTGMIRKQGVEQIDELVNQYNLSQKEI